MLDICFQSYALTRIMALVARLMLFNILQRLALRSIEFHGTFGDLGMSK